MERRLHFSNISPKTTFYASDGTGRDSYIVHDSGGIIKKKNNDLPSLTIHGQSSGFRYKDHKTLHSITKNNNIKHYISDGSGRDQYILVNEGGLSFPYYSNNHHETFFSNSLRNYGKSGRSITNIRDFFQEAQRCKTAKEVIQQKSLVMRQRDLVFRLTTPKKKERCRSYKRALPTY